jgi:hypothetical protein
MTMRPILFVGLWVACLLGGCMPSQDVPEGRWSGTLTPSTADAASIPVVTEVRYGDGLLSVTLDGLQGQGAEPISARNPRVRGETLAFAFTEPYDRLLVECTVVRRADGAFAGRCMDGREPWADLILYPPGRP